MGLGIFKSLIMKVKEIENGKWHQIASDSIYNPQVHKAEKKQVEEPRLYFDWRQGEFVIDDEPIAEDEILHII